MEPEERAWLACAIDCDGHVGIKLQKQKQKGKIYEYVMPLIGFSNTSPPLTDRFGELIDSKIHHNRKQSRPYEEKRISKTSTQGTKKIKAILEQIIPYMIAKRKRAEFVLEFCNHKLSTPGDHGRGRSARLNEDLKLLQEYQELFPSHRRNRTEDPP